MTYIGDGENLRIEIIDADDRKNSEERFALNISVSELVLIETTIRDYLESSEEEMKEYKDYPHTNDIRKAKVLKYIRNKRELAGKVHKELKNFRDSQ